MEAAKNVDNYSLLDSAQFRTLALRYTKGLGARGKMTIGEHYIDMQDWGSLPYL